MKFFDSIISVPSNVTYIMKKLISTDKKLGWICISIVLVGLGIPLSNVLFPKFVLWSALQENHSYVLLLGIIAVFFVITSVCNGIHNYYIRRNNFYLTNFGFKLQEDIQSIAMTMPFEMTEDRNVLNEMELAKACISKTQPIIETLCRCISASLLLIGYAFLIAMLNPLVLLIFIVCVCLDAKIMKKLKMQEAEFRESVAETGRKKNYLFRTMFDYRYGKEIRLFHLEDILTKKFTEQKNRAYDLNHFLEGKKTKMQGIELFLVFLCEASIYLFLLMAYLNHGMSVDDFVLYTGLTASFHVISKGLIADIGVLLQLNVSIGDYRKFVEQNSKYALEAQAPIKNSLQSVKPRIVFDHVSFRYPQSEHDVLKDVSFVIEPGTHVSIVGLNGAGKSTIVKLLCRLYRPVCGKILIDGKDIWTYEMQEYRHLLSAVFQESKLFACTIAENICLEENPNLEKMWEALQAVGMEEKIRSLPQQEDSNALKYLYDDGMEFSGGETQRLCIARAVYKQGKILILDEPTAALDALAEKSIYESFSQISKGKTTVFISHRLNSNRFCDKVIYLENGQITSQGTHEELMECCIPYRKLYLMQAKYYLSEERSN